MAIHRNRDIIFGTVILASGMILGSWLFSSPPARALSNSQQLITGGNSTTENSTRFTGFGFGNSFTADFPAAGLGEKAAQVRMIGNSVLKKLYVRIYTATVPSSGSFTLTIRLNRADTALTCAIAAGSNSCQALGTTVSVNNGDRIAVRAANNFVGSGNIAYSYSLILD